MGMRQLIQDLEEATAPKKDTVKLLDSLRKRMKRRTAKDLQHNEEGKGYLVHPDATLADLAKMGQDALDLAIPTIKAYQKVLDTEGARSGGYEAKALYNRLEDARNAVDNLQHLIGDPSGFVAKATVYFGMYDDNTNAAIHYHDQTDVLRRALRAASAYVAVLKRAK